MTDSGTTELHQRLQSMVSDASVLLFMKGDRGQPQCGFSSQVVQILDRVLEDYQTVNVLEDAELRDGIKEFSDWPTIPQLYVGGEFQGGCDIVNEMYSNGELHAALGLQVPAIDDVVLNISDAAVALLEGAKAQYDGGEVHLGIDARYQHSLAFGPPGPGMVMIEANGMKVLMDPDSAGRANGLVIDVKENAQGQGLLIDNPNAPKDPEQNTRDGVPQMSVEELDQLRRSSSPHVLVDVRTEKERAIALIEEGLWIEQALGQVQGLDKDHMIVFYCHSGQRSQHAAASFLSQGFTNVHNLTGGIDAWSVRVDQDIARY